LSPHGIRSLSRVHRERPFVLRMDGQEYEVHYTPAESDSGLFGGNSNWRGPVWFPLNYLLAEALERYHHFYGNDLRAECPTGSGRESPSAASRTWGGAARGEGMRTLLWVALALIAQTASAESDVPPRRKGPLLAWLKAGTYRASYVAEPAVHVSSSGAHGMNVRTWYDPIL